MRRILPWLLIAASASAAAAETEPISIGTARGVRGQTVRGSLKVAEAADGSPVAMPIAIVTGAKPGPVVWVQAAAHGDEYGGPRALQDVVKGLDPQAMSGSVVAVLVANVPALQGLQRVNPNLDDLADFGSVFPGRERFATERIAAAISAEVKRVANHFIDMHTGGDRFRQLPFVFYTVKGKVPAGPVRHSGARLRHPDAVARRGPDLRRRRHDGVQRRRHSGVSSRGRRRAAARSGGHPDAGGRRAELSPSRRRAAGRASAGRHAGIFTGYRIVTNARGGFFEAAVKPGDRVRGGSPLGKMIDAWGDTVETLTAPSEAGEAIVIGVSTYPAAATGGWLFELGSGLKEVSK